VYFTIKKTIRITSKLKEWW